MQIFSDCFKGREEKSHEIMIGKVGEVSAAWRPRAERVSGQRRWRTLAVAMRKPFQRGRTDVRLTAKLSFKVYF